MIAPDLSKVRVVALTGAGISAESGVPTFRGKEGHWRNYRAEDLATPEAFATQPHLVWEWYDWRRKLIALAKPNAAHLVLVRPNVTVVTQNVDGLHDLAGTRNLIKLHGDIWEIHCTKCPRRWLDRRVPLPELPPKCICGGMGRPGVVWFGEPLPEAAMESAKALVRAAEVVLVVGTSAVVQPAAGLIRIATGKVIEVNVEDTPYTGSSYMAIRGRAAEVLPKLFR